MTRRLRWLGASLVAAALAACSSPSTAAQQSAVITPAPSSTTSTTAVSTTVSTTPSTTSSASSTSTSTSTSTPVAGAGDALGEEVIGTSAQGRPITAKNRAPPGATVVLVVGVIHGNENAGLGVLDLLDTMPLPPGLDLWLMPAMNPDGLANNVRGNGNGVDLNRNFPHDWTAIAQPGDWQYSGSGPASEPETQAFMAFTQRIAPVLTLWYHQDLFRISPSKGRDAPLRQRYAELTGLPYESITGGKYTGVAATWIRTQVPEAMSFVIELGPSLSAAEAAVHAAAVLDVAAMA
ncbi:MAG: hypothetical protein RLZ14_579 [Actinomycetota bacterium]